METKIKGSNVRRVGMTSVTELGYNILSMYIAILYVTRKIDSLSNIQSVRRMS